MLVNVIIAFQYLQWTMENVFIFIVFRVFTADTNMERSEEIDPTRRERESWYLEIIDLNMVTITPLSPQLGQWEHISFVFSLSQINNYWLKRVDPWHDVDTQSIWYWDQSRICVTIQVWQNYKFVLNFVQIVIVQISLQQAGARRDCDKHIVNWEMSELKKKGGYWTLS